MSTRLNVDETRTSLDHIVKQIKDLEGFVESIYRNGTGPFGTSSVCYSATESLYDARSKIEGLICRYDS